MERGHLYPAESPSSYNKGQTGKGVTVGGRVTAKEGSSFPQGNDGYAAKLRETWNKAKNAAGRFGKF